MNRLPATGSKKETARGPDESSEHRTHKTVSPRNGLSLSITISLSLSLSHTHTWGCADKTPVSPRSRLTDANFCQFAQCRGMIPAGMNRLPAIGSKKKKRRLLALTNASEHRARRHESQAGSNQGHDRCLLASLSAAALRLLV